MQTETHNGWAVEFRKNIHMYCHSLKVAKAGIVHEIQCEDSPLSDGLIAMWPYALNLKAEEFQDLLKGLREWAQNSGFKYRIYTSRNDYESNDA